MAQAKKAQQVWNEIESLKNNLIQNILPSLKKSKEDFENYSSELFTDSTESVSVRTNISKLKEKLRLKQQDY